MLDGLCPAPPADWEFRRRLLDEAASSGAERLHQRLASVDAAAAARIHPGNVRRVIRALEVYERSGQPLSRLQQQTSGLADRYRVVMVGLTAPRAVLYRWIDARVEEMLRSGLVGEVRRLLARPISRTAAAVLGVSEIAGYLRSERSLEEAARLLQRNSRRYAKRQMTWFRADPRVRWLERDPLTALDLLVDRVASCLPIERHAATASATRVML